MNIRRSVHAMTLVVTATAVLGLSLSVDGGAQSLDRPALGGLWTLNADLSDQPPGRPEGGGDPGDRGERGGRGGGSGRGGGRRGGGGGGGGFGGGGFGRGGGMGRDDGRGNAEQAARVRDAMRDLTEPPAHLTITQTETMVVLTAPDGRTTRLSPDGQKVKDENTKMERKTRWESGKLISEISGLGPGKMTQSFSVDPEHHQLRVTLVMEGGGRSGQPRTIAHVYDADAR